MPDAFPLSSVVRVALVGTALMSGGRVGWGLVDRGLGFALELGPDGVGGLVEGGMMGVFVVRGVVVALAAATYAPVPPLFHKPSAIV